MYYIKTHITRAGSPHNSVQVGSIVVEQSSGTVNFVRYFLDAGFKETQCTGICEHNACQGVIQIGIQSRRVQHPVGSRRNGYNIEPGQMGTGRIGAVGAVGNQKSGAFFLSPGSECGSKEFHSGELPMGTGHRLQGSSGHACYLT